MSRANSNSYFSRSTADLITAANSAGWAIFTAIKRENRGFFVKFDTTTITLTPGQSFYTLPPDFSQLIHFSERRVSSEPYHPLGHTSIGNALDFAQIQTGFNNDTGYYGGQSRYSFDGPYLPAPTNPTPNAPQIYQMDIIPAIDTVRMTELVYIANWIEIIDQNSVVMLPTSADAAWLALTTAELLDMNSDSQAETYRSKVLLPNGAPGPLMYLLLSEMRNKQTQVKPRVQMFGEWN